jgi:hypothetical protein
MPILGVIASSTRQGQATDTGVMFPIFSTTLTSSASTITFSNIPQTYTHLQLRVVAQNTENVSGEGNWTMNFNSDTTYTNYRSHWVRGNGTSLDSNNVQAVNYYVYLGTIACSPSTQTSIFSSYTIDVLDYKNTNKFKTVRTLGGTDLNGASSFIGLYSSVWLSTSAITGITFRIPSGDSYSANTQIALYGIKGE